MGGRRIIIAPDGGQAFGQGGIGKRPHVVDVVDKGRIENIVLGQGINRVHHHVQGLNIGGTLSIGKVEYPEPGLVGSELGHI